MRENLQALNLNALFALILFTNQYLLSIIMYLDGFIYHFHTLFSAWNNSAAYYNLPRSNIKMKGVKLS